jgi:hypothetical protein
MLNKIDTSQKKPRNNIDNSNFMSNGIIGYQEWSYDISKHFPKSKIDIAFTSSHNKLGNCWMTETPNYFFESEEGGRFCSNLVILNTLYQSVKAEPAIMHQWYRPNFLTAPFNGPQNESLDYPLFCGFNKSVGVETGMQDERALKNQMSFVFSDRATSSNSIFESLSLVAEVLSPANFRAVFETVWYWHFRYDVPVDKIYELLDLIVNLLSF